MPGLRSVRLSDDFLWNRSGLLPRVQVESFYEFVSASFGVCMLTAQPQEHVDDLTPGKIRPQLHVPGTYAKRRCRATASCHGSRLKIRTVPES